MDNSIIKKGLCGCLVAWAAAAAALGAGPTNSALASWIAAQKNIQSWQADFVQTRTFKSLSQPLMATGRVWFAEPNRFRWELGSPPKTIAVRGGNDMLVMYPM